MFEERLLRMNRGEMSIAEKLWRLSWSLILWLSLASCVGFLMLYSAANGSFEPWASRQMVRFFIALGVLLLLSLIDIRALMRYAYALYGVVLILLILVELKGTVGMGAQRWIDLGIIQIQPSEIMKVSLILTLSRYFHGASLEDMGRVSFLTPPLLLTLAPVVLVLKQPDMGTALMLLVGAGVLFFVAGVRLWMFALVIALGLAALPVAWHFMHDYQKNRILTFLDPGREPLGAGYHITQSKIALGSGGVFGKGFMQGTQSHLKFLPERQTDFIFTMLGEEWGMLGGMALLALYSLILIYGFAISARARHQFGRLTAAGVTTTFFLYVFVNIAMVMGLIPVVGVPLPLISYGGTAMMTLMMAFGVLMSVHIHRDVQMGRRGGFDEF